MSQVGQFLQYAEERDSPRRRVSSSVWKYSPPARASEYHLIDLATGVSHGGFETLTGARQYAARKKPTGLGHLPRQCSGRVPRSA